MLDKLNKIRNYDFSDGIRKPKVWRWLPNSERVTYYQAPSNNGDLGGVQIVSHTEEGTGLWCQSFRIKKNQCYRIEAVVSCDCDSGSRQGGLVLTVVPFCEDERQGSSLMTVPLQCATRETVRCYYKATSDVRKLELRIGLSDTRGSAIVHNVAVVPVIDVECKSHPWALTGLSYSDPAPVTVRSACVVTNERGRPIVGILKAALGERKVNVCTASELSSTSSQVDMLLLPEAMPPKRCNSIAALKALARNRVVVISLQAFEALSDEHLLTRTIRQSDDPLHARVRYAGFATAGLALYDMVPFAGRGKHSTTMTQRQFRTNKVFTAFCRDHGFEVLLDSVTDSEATSSKPISLIHQSRTGAIVVMDIEPAEALASSLDEPNIAAHILCNLLGSRRGTAGQYTTCPHDNVEFLHDLCDMVDRFSELRFSGDVAPDDPSEPCLVTVGPQEPTVANPIPSRPVVLLRTGLPGDSLLASYGVMLWLKQLLRLDPYESPYAQDLASTCRITWVPRVSFNDQWGGWKPIPEEEAFIEAEFEPGTIAACIDITTTDRHGVHVLTKSKDSFHHILASALPQLAEQFICHRHLYRAVPAGRSLIDRSNITWRVDDLTPAVSCGPQLFTDPLHLAASNAGARLVRIELPGLHTEPLGNSIWRNHWTVLLLEHIVGLLYGMVVVNRDAVDMEFCWPETLRDLYADAVMRRMNEPGVDLPLPTLRNGKMRLPKAHAVIAPR